MLRIFQDAQGLIYKAHEFEELGREEAEKLLHDLEDGLAVVKSYLARVNAQENPPAAPTNGDSNAQPSTEAPSQPASPNQPSASDAPQGDQAGSTPADPGTQVASPPAPTDPNPQPPAPVDQAAPATDPNPVQPEQPAAPQIQ